MQYCTWFIAVVDCNGLLGSSLPSKATFSEGNWNAVLIIHLETAHIITASNSVIPTFKASVVHQKVMSKGPLLDFFLFFFVVI